MTEPIVPVNKGGTIAGLWRQAVEAADLCGAVNIDLDHGDAERVARTLRLPLVDLADLDSRSPLRWTTRPIALPRDSPNVPILACTDSDLWMAVAAGDTTEDREFEFAAAHFPVRRVAQADWIAREVIGKGTLLDQSVEAFEEQSASAVGAIPAIIWITRPDSLADCLFFWNLRALRSLRHPSPMYLLPDGRIQDWIEFGRLVQDSLPRRAEVSPDVLLAGISVKKGQLDDAAEHLDLVRSTDAPRIGRLRSAELHSPPFTYLTSDEMDPWPWFLGRRRYGKSTEVEAHFHLGHAVPSVASPVSWRGPGRTLLSLRSPVLDMLPKRPAVASLVIRNATWSDDALQIATVATTPYNLKINLPTLNQALDAVLAERTLDHGPSDKGRLAAALADRAIDLLESGVYEAACSLSTPRSKELLRELRAMHARGKSMQDIEEVATAWGGRVERRYRSVPRLNAPSGAKTAEALERLSAMGWAERGLEVSCSGCGMKGFVALHSTTAEARCPGCGSPQSYTRDGPGQGPAIQYRLNTLVDRAVDQGVLPHLLVVAALAQRHPATLLRPGVDVELAGWGTAEIDIVGLHGGKIVVGEVKSSPSDFTRRQIRRDVALSSLLGADTYLMAAVGEVGDAARQEAARVTAKAGIDLMVLDRSDLRPAGA